MSVDRFVVVVLLVWRGCAGQQARDPAERIRAAMQASLDAQKASVQAQDSSVRVAPRNKASSNSFFTVPWPAQGAEPAIEEPAAETVPISGNGACEPLTEPVLATLINDTAERESLKPSVLRALI